MGPTVTTSGGAVAAGGRQAPRRPFVLDLTIVLMFGIIAQGPIFWLPGVDVDSWSVAKSACLLPFLVWGLWVAARRGKNPFAYLAGGTGGWLLVVLAAASLVGVASSANPGASLLVWLRFPMAVCLVCAAYSVLRERPQLLPVLEWAVCVGVGVSAFYIVLAEAHLLPKLSPPAKFLVEESDEYTMGFSYRRNAMCGGIALAWAVCLYRLLFAPRRPGAAGRGLFLAGFGLVLATAAVITSGRGGLIQMAAITLFGLALWGARRGPRALAVVVLLAVAGGGAFGAGQLLQWQRAEVLSRGAVGSNGQVDWNRLSSRRVEVMEAALRSIQEQPFSGVGLGQFADVAPRYGGPNYEVHNLYLNLTAEAGVLAGAAALLFSVWATWRWVEYSWRKRNSIPCHYLICLAFVLAGILDTYYEPGSIFLALQGALPFWFGLAALEAARANASAASLPAPRAAVGRPREMTQPGGRLVGAAAAGRAIR